MSDGAKDAQRTPKTVPAGGAGAGTSMGILSRRPIEADLGPLPRRMGRYEVLERIGSGGMGTVFRARQLPIDRIVALKILSPDLADDNRYIRRFVREARAAGALNHPNAVVVHDVGRVEGHHSQRAEVHVNPFAVGGGCGRCLGVGLHEFRQRTGFQFLFPKFFT